MSSMLSIVLRKGVVLLSCAILLGFAASVRADPKPLSKAEQAKVDKAIDKAVAYLKRTQTKQGDWPRKWPRTHLAGQCALPAYALLEAGVPANDRVIQKAATFIRASVLKTDGTYEISLAILFFDRLGDLKDKKLIQSLALRLIAGQFYTGGWSYHCPKLKAVHQADLLKTLEELSKRMKEGGKSTKEALKEVEVPQRIKRLAVFKDLKKFNWSEQQGRPGVTESIPLVGTTDNSNTQFALLALWAAQRHDIPTEPSFRLLVERFEKSQFPNGKWSYGFPYGGGSHRSMVCVGLLGLAIGRGLKLTTPGSPPPGQDDLPTMAGLAALYSVIGVPTEQMDKVVPTQDIYFLWSLERVGMLFNLPTLGDKEWYRWGAEILVTNQFTTGEWDNLISDTKSFGANLYGPVLHTAFALLFLKHSHPMKELTPKLPYKAKELNQGIARLRGGDTPLNRSTATPSHSTKPERYK
jgi:hypothetical protein